MFVFITSSDDDDDDDRGGDFHGADDFPRKKISADKSKPVKATEVSSSLLAVKSLISLHPWEQTGLLF